MSMLHILILLYVCMAGTDVLMMLSAVTDPAGVQQRKKHKLKCSVSK